MRRNCSAHEQASLRVTSRKGETLSGIDVLYCNEAEKLLLFVYNRKLFDLLPVHNPLCFFYSHFRSRENYLLCHDISDNFVCVGKVDISLRQDASESFVASDHGQS